MAGDHACSDQRATEVTPRALHVCVVTEMTGGAGVSPVTLSRIWPAQAPCSALYAAPGCRTCRRPCGAGHARCGPWQVPGQAWSFARAMREMPAGIDLVHAIDARYSLFFFPLDVPVVGTMNDYFYAVTGWFSGRGTKNVYSDWRVRHIYYNLTRVLERLALPRLDGFCASRGRSKTCLRDSTDWRGTVSSSSQTGSRTDRPMWRRAGRPGPPWSSPGGTSSARGSACSSMRPRASSGTSPVWR